MRPPRGKMYSKNSKRVQGQLYNIPMDSRGANILMETINVWLERERLRTKYGQSHGGDLGIEVGESNQQSKATKCQSRREQPTVSKDQIWTAGFTSEDVSDLGEGVSSGMQRQSWISGGQERNWGTGNQDIGSRQHTSGVCRWTWAIIGKSKKGFRRIRETVDCLKAEWKELEKRKRWRGGITEGVGS